MSVVLDASVSLAWLFEDEATPAIDALFREVAGLGAFVPGLWRLEIANGLRMSVRRRRVAATYVATALSRFSALPILIDPETNDHAWSATLHLADSYRLTPYDAAYLELAQRRRLPLASLDESLRDAATKAGVETLGR